MFSFARPGRPAVLAVLLLIAAVLAPYYGMLAGRELPIPDDIFVSDLVDGEYPVRLEAARILVSGEAPVWTNRILTGAPIIVDPLSTAVLAILPPAVGLGFIFAVLLTAAATGAYLLARHLGAGRSGSFLAGFAYAWSGVMVCQMRHIAEFGPMVLFPLAVYFLERATGSGEGDARTARAMPLHMRIRWLAGFGAVFGLQLLFAFPQTAYYSALAYGALVLARCVWLAYGSQAGESSGERLKPAFHLALGSLVAVMLGVLVGMAAVLPLWELGSVSDRSAAMGFEWASTPAYLVSNWKTFFVPYANGDVANGTYGQSIFWEDYGYVGLATVLLALLAMAVRIRRFNVAFWTAVGAAAYVMVLGKATPIFRFAFDYFPGMSRFRFPTRFLFMVELALALLAGIGLTLAEDFLRKKFPGEKPLTLVRLAVLAVVAATAADLVYHNRHQNPFADAERWLGPPATAAAIKRSGEAGRVYTPAVRGLHISMFRSGPGWSGDLTRFYEFREFLQPNGNLLHGVSALDGYYGISPRWTDDVLGSHNRKGFLEYLYNLGQKGFQYDKRFFDWLEALSVRWLILPGPISNSRVELAAVAPPAYLYRLPGTLPRARIVERARLVQSADKNVLMSAMHDMNPREEMLVEDARAASLISSLPGPNAGGPPAGAAMVVDRDTETVVEAVSPRGGFLVLADTYYPGWEATVDGRPAEIFRANMSGRAVHLTPGTHKVTFKYSPRSFRVGFLLTLAGALALAAAFIGFGRAGKKS